MFTSTPRSSKRSKKSFLAQARVKLAAHTALALLAASSQFADAATQTWTGSVSGSFNAGGNWVSGTAPVAGDNLIFSGTNNLAVTNTANLSLSTAATDITFDSTAGSFNIGGTGTLTLGSGGGGGLVIIQQNSANAQTISANINLSGGNGDRSIVFGAGAGSLTLSGNINFGTTNGDWLFPTTTAGTIVLSGNNTGDGKATAAVTAGTNVMRAMMRNNVAGTTLVLGSDTALGNSGTGDASLGTASLRGVIANQNLVLSTTGGNRNLSGSSIAINAANVNFAGTNNLTLGNIMVVSGNRDFLVSSTGQVTVGNVFMSNDGTGRNLFANMSGTGGMVVTGKLFDTFSSTGVTTGTSTFRKAGTGTIVLNGDSSNYNGLITVEAGTLKIGHANALGATGATKQTTLTGNATLDLNGLTIGETLVVNNNGNSFINTSSTAALVSADVTLNAPITLNATGDMTFTRLIGNATRLVTKLGTGTVTTNGTSHNNLTQWDIQAGNVVFANTSGLAADRGVTLNGGTLKLSGANSDLINDGQTFTINTGIFDLNNKSEAVAAITGNSGTLITNSNTGTSTLFVGGGVSGTSSGTYAGVIQNGAGTMKVTKEGTGTQVLSGVNTYTGATTVSKGTLQIAGSITSAVTVNNTGIVSGGGTINGGVVVNAGGALAPGNAGVGNLSVTGNVNLSNSTAAYNWDFDNAGAMGTAGVNYDLLTMTGAASTLSLGGVINVNLTSGDFTNAFWDSNQSFQITNVTNTAGTTGSMTISATGAGGQGIFTSSVVGGNVFINWQAIGGIGQWIGASGGSWNTNTNWNGSTVPGSNYNLEFGALGSGGTVLVDSAHNVDNGNQISLVNGTGGSYDLQAGASGSLNLTGAVTVTTPTSGETHTISAPITGPGSLTKTGAGTLVLSGANTYAGSTTINTGTLQVGGASVLGSAPVVSVSSGATLDLNGNNQAVSSIAGVSGATVTSASAATLSINGSSTTTFAGAITGAVGVTNGGTGTITLSGANTYTGNTNLNGGTVVIPNNQYSPFGTGTVTLNGTSSTTPIITALPGSGGYNTSNASRITNDIVVAPGSVNVIDNSANAFGNLWIGGNVSGSGKIVFQDTNPALSNFTASGALLFIGDKLGSFTGTIELGTVANSFARSWAFVAMSDDGSSPVSQWDASQASFILGNNPTGGAGMIKWNQSANGGTIKLGSLAGQSTQSQLQAGNNVNTTFEIGAVGSNTTFAGQIVNGTGTGVASLTKVGSGLLKLSNAAQTYTGPTVVNGGTLELAGAHNANQAGYTVNNSGTLKVGTGGAINASGTPNTLTVNGTGVADINGGQATFSSVNGTNVSVQNNGVLTIAALAPTPIASANKISNLTIATGGVVDIKNNALLLASTDTTDAARDARWAQVLTGQNNFDNNGQVTWDGPGLVSSTARTNNLGLGVDAFVIGVASNHDLAKLSVDGGAAIPYDAGNPWLGTVSSVGADDILIRMTYAGDTNLDGTVTIDDYNNIDGTFTGLLPTNYGWVSGDFDFNGAITIDDYNAIDSGFLYQGGQLTQGMIAARTAMFGADYVAHLEAVAAAFASVPEPTTVGMLAVGAMGLLSRRRRK